MTALKLISFRILVPLIILVWLAACQAKPLQPYPPEVIVDPGKLINTTSVVARDSYVYASSSGDGLIVFDVKDPTLPRVISRAFDIEGANTVSDNVVLIENYAYLPVRSDGLKVLDVSDPSNLKVLSTRPFTEAAGMTVTYSQNHLFLSGIIPEDIDEDEIQWQIYSLQDLAEPVLLKTVPGLGRPLNQFNNVIYAWRWPYRGETDIGSGALQIIDVTDSTNPILIEEISKWGSVGGIEVQAPYLFLASLDHGLIVLDGSDPGNPIEVSRIKMSGYDMIEIGGDFAYLASIYHVRVVDISDPHRPVLVAENDIRRADALLVIDESLLTFLFNKIYVSPAFTHTTE